MIYPYSNLCKSFGFFRKQPSDDGYSEYLSTVPFLIILTTRMTNTYNIILKMVEVTAYIQYYDDRMITPTLYSVLEYKILAISTPFCRFSHILGMKGEKKRAIFI